MKLLLLLVVAVYLCLETVARESHRKPDLGTLSKVFKKGVVRLCRGVQLLDDVEVTSLIDGICRFQINYSICKWGI